MNNNIQCLETFKLLKDLKAKDEPYRKQLLLMDKTELLCELLRYDDAYRKNPLDLRITLRGQHLMDVLEQRAELTELKDLAQDFNIKLQKRYNHQIQKIVNF